MCAVKTKKPTRTKYWSVPNGRSLVSKLRWQLDAVMAFAKCNLAEQASGNLSAEVQAFAEFMLASDYGSQLDWIGRALNAHTRQVQRHLRKRLHQIAGETTFGVEQSLWKVRASLTFSKAPIEGRYVERLSLDPAKRTNDLKKLAAVVDLRLIELVRDLELKPQRFRHCDRCHVVFYQPTERVKNFCSPRCAGTVRQARYERRKRVVNKSHIERR